MLSPFAHPSAQGKGESAIVSRPSRAPLQLWLLLNALDTFQTWLFLSMGAMEGNPIIASLISSLGTEQAMLAKFLAGALVGCWLWRDARWNPLRLLNLAMAGVVAWNLAAIALTLG